MNVMASMTLTKGPLLREISNQDFLCLAMMIGLLINKQQRVISKNIYRVVIR